MSDVCTSGFNHVSVHDMISGLTCWMTWWRSGILFLIDLQLMLRRVILSFALTLVRCLRLPLLLGVDVAIGEATSTVVWIPDCCNRWLTFKRERFEVRSANGLLSLRESSDVARDWETFVCPQDRHCQTNLESDRHSYVLSPIFWQSMWNHCSQLSHNIPLCCHVTSSLHCPQGYRNCDALGPGFEACTSHYCMGFGARPMAPESER